MTVHALRRLAAVMLSLIETAQLCEVDPKAWLVDVLARIADNPVQQIDALLPWYWKADRKRTGRSPCLGIGRAHAK